MYTDTLSRAPTGYRKCTDKQYRGPALDRSGTPVQVFTHDHKADGTGRHAFWVRSSDGAYTQEFVYVQR